jgi:hypothetical protein
MCPTFDKRRRAGGFLRIQSLVASFDYELVGHAREGVESNDFSSADIEASIASGQVIKKQKDETQSSIGNKKYTIVGNALCGRPIYSVGKLISTDDGVCYRFLTIKCDGDQS